LQPPATSAEDANVQTAETRYARAPDGTYLAYQVVGDGPVDLVWQFDFFGNVDIAWEIPDWAAWFTRLASVSRLILHDRRGTGLSSRNVPVPNLETRVDDLRVVLDTVGAHEVVLSSTSEGGCPHVLLAAMEPDRIRSLIWWSPSARSVWAPDYPWGAGPDYVERSHRAIEETWGTPEYGPAFREAESIVVHHLDPSLDPLSARLSRHTGTPDVALEMERIWNETDVRTLLPLVQVPALLLAMDGADVEEARYVDSLMPTAELQILPGTNEYAPATQDAALEAIRSFLGVDRRTVGLDTVLSSVLFTDIVDSTEHQAAVGDLAWKALVERHHATVRDALVRWRGVENDTAGDGFYATFDGPARAVRCALEIVERVRDLGVQIRAGVHTGECEVIDGKYGGLTVSIGARVASTAAASEVLVSQTVKDLVAGSGLAFEDRGTHELKGVPDRWRLYRALQG
jgi:class 3 adenylate cyclase